MPSGISLRQNFGWAFFGNTLFQASQWLMIVILAKITSVEQVGRFALAVAVATPVMTLASLGLAAAQISDARHEFKLGHYMALRLVCAFGAMVTLGGIVAFSDYSPADKALILVVGAWQAAFWVREIILSFMQKQERMDRLAGSQVIHSAVSFAVMIVVVWATRSVLAGVVGLVLARLAILLTWDTRAAGRLAGQLGLDPAQGRLHPAWDWSALWRLFILVLPLGLTGAVNAFSSNVPRYVIEDVLDLKALGYFAALASLPVAGTMVVQAATFSASPRLARYYQTNRSAYRVLLGKLVTLSVGLAVVGLAVTAVAGRWILTVVFKPEYAEYHRLLNWLMAYGGLVYVANAVGVAMTSARRFRILLPLFVAVAVVVIVSCRVLIPRFGLTGAAWALMAGTAVQVLGSVAVIHRALAAPAPAAAQDVSGPGP